MDEINPDRMKLVLTFFLGKGSYATELVRQAAGEQKAVISKI
jgi:tRNA(Glu) U13 pseudouridine synthase TruD